MDVRDLHGAVEEHGGSSRREGEGGHPHDAAPLLPEKLEADAGQQHERQ